MKTLYFSVYDKKTQSYGQLFPSQTRGAAERSFQQSVKDDSTIVSKYPGDFALYTILEFDDEKGLVTEAYVPPQLVVEASALLDVN